MADEVIGKVSFQVVVDDQTASGIKKAGENVQKGAEGVNKQLAPATKEAASAADLLNNRTSKLQVILRATGTEIGNTAANTIGLAEAFVSGASKAGLLAVGVTALAAGMMKLYESSEAVKETKELGTWVDDQTKRVEAFRKELEAASEAASNSGPAEKRLEKIKIDIESALAAEADILAEIKEQNKGVRWESAFGLTGDLHDALERVRKNYANLAVLVQIAEQQALEEQVQSNNKKLADFIEYGNKKLAAQEKANREALQLEREQYQAFEKLKDEQSELLAQEYAANVEASNKRLAAAERVAQLLDELDQQINRYHEDRLNAKYAIQEKLAAREEKLLKEAAAREEEEARKRKERTLQWIDTAEAGMGASIQIAGMFDLFGEKSAKNEEERARAVGVRMGFENIIAAATETAKAVASFENPPAAVMHAIAAALHTAAAVKCFADPSSVGGASGATPTGGAVSSGQQQAMQWARESEDRKRKLEGTGGGVTINIYGHQINAQGADREFANGVARWYKQQNPNASTGRL